QNAERFNTLEAAGRSANLLRDGPCNSNVGSIEKNVVSNKEFGRAYGRGPCLRVQCRTAKIGPARGVLAHGVAETFKLSLAHVFQIGAVRARGSGLVKVNGYAKAAPDLHAGLAGEQRALIELDAGDRNKRDHIRCSDPGMNALLDGEVNELGSLPCSAHRGFNDSRRR